MDQPPSPRPDVDAARAFDLMADTYDRARPSYPDDAVDWLLSGEGAIDAPRVLELGAGTGKLTEQLLARGCRVVATDPSEAMLSRLAARAPRAARLAARAEQVPVGDHACDLVVAAQAFHWFDAPAVLDEIARVLAPGGRIAVVWSSRDERIPWVKRLGKIVGTPARQEDPTEALDESGMFESVERATFRFWQPMTQESLRDLVASRSNVALMSGRDRDRVLEEVDELYDGYGRGADGMLLPYVTTVCRTRVLPWAPPHKAARLRAGGTLPAGEPGGSPDTSRPVGGPPPALDDSLLIDFK